MLGELARPTTKEAACSCFSEGILEASKVCLKASVHLQFFCLVTLFVCDQYVLREGHVEDSFALCALHNASMPSWRAMTHAPATRRYLALFSVALAEWINVIEELKWVRHLEKMAQRMLHGSSLLKAAILVGERELGKVVKSDDGRVLIAIDIMSVPWGAFKDQGKLRFRIEAFSTPNSSPCNTPPATIERDRWQKKPQVSVSPSSSPLYMSSSSPAPILSFPTDIHSPSSISTCAQASSASRMSPSRIPVDGLALYTGLVARTPSQAEDAGRAPLWGMSVEVDYTASSADRPNHRPLHKKYELLAQGAARAPRVKGLSRS